MGWASAGNIVDSVIRSVKDHVPAETRRTLYAGLIEALEDNDWDTQYESLGQDYVFDQVMRERHPNWDWNEIEVAEPPVEKPLFVRGVHYEPGERPRRSVDFRLGYYQHKPGTETPFLGIRFAEATEYHGIKVPEGSVLRLSEVVSGEAVDPTGVAVPTWGRNVPGSGPVPPTRTRADLSPAEARDARPVFEDLLGDDDGYDLPSEIAESLLQLSIKQLSDLWSSVPEEVLQTFKQRPPPPKSKEERLAEVRAKEDRHRLKERITAEAASQLQSFCTVENFDGLAGFLWEAISEPETDPVFDTYVSRLVTIIQAACKDVIELDESVPVFRDPDAANEILKQLARDLDAIG